MIDKPLSKQFPMVLYKLLKYLANKHNELLIQISHKFSFILVLAIS